MVGKQEILNWFKGYMNASEVDLVDDSSDEYARHVCVNGFRVELLPKSFIRVPTPRGEVYIEYYFCNLCGKLIINRNFM